MGRLTGDPFDRDSDLYREVVAPGITEPEAVLVICERIHQRLDVGVPDRRVVCLAWPDANPMHEMAVDVVCCVLALSVVLHGNFPFGVDAIDTRMPCGSAVPGCKRLSVSYRIIVGMSENDRVNAESIATARAAGWPDLTGTPRQIGWANTIRVAKMREYEAAAPAMSDSDQRKFRVVMLRHTDASTWIANRSYPWQAMLAASFNEQELAELGPDSDRSFGSSDS